MRRARLVRMAWGTYHTDHTAPRPSLKSWVRGNPSMDSISGTLASGWTAEKSAIACSEKERRT